MASGYVTLYKIVEELVPVVDLDDPYLLQCRVDNLNVCVNANKYFPSSPVKQENIKIHRLINGDEELYVAYDKDVVEFLAKYQATDANAVNELADRLHRVENDLYKAEIEMGKMYAAIYEHNHSGFWQKCIKAWNEEDISY